MSFRVWRVVLACLAICVLSLTCATATRIEYGKPLSWRGQFYHHDHEATAGKWPWHAALYRRKGAEMKYFCGGTVLNLDTILTAAHCVSGEDGVVDRRTISVQLGRTGLNETQDSVQSLGVRAIIVHPMFSGVNVSHDIALIKLQDNITISSSVRPVRVWNREVHEPIVGQNGTIVGYGIVVNNIASDRLKYALVSVVNMLECTERSSFASVQTDGMICGKAQRGVSACFGDGGGGMFMQLDGRWFVRGIISFTPGQDYANRLCEGFQYTGIVVVTFNYRLAALGFLSLPDLGINANLGLLDQLEALRWTARNAPYFGGDPARVTLCGWSAGAASVTYHLYSPAARGLFQRAIIMSGSMTQSWAYDFDPDRCGREYLRANDATTRDQLQSRSLAQLMSIERTLQMDFFSLFYYCFLPSDDSYRPEPELRFVGRDPFARVRNEPPVSDVPLLVGYTTLEHGNLFLDREFTHTMPNFPNANETVHALLEEYLDRQPLAAANRSTRRRFYQELASVADIIYGIQYFIRHVAAHQRAPLYRYLFAYDGKFGYAKNWYYRNQILRADLPGPMHGDELGYLFTPYLYRGRGWQDIEPGAYRPERRMQRRMLRLWSNFIKHGNPTPGVVEQRPNDERRKPVRWYPYNDPSPERARHYLRIDRRMQLLPEADSENPFHRLWDRVSRCLYAFDCEFLNTDEATGSPPDA
uniref:Carboxylic ester hydrolase n=1 Tax=Anopheles farauti TaxID=69004 RepID=A0A182QDN4_9DIPT